MVLRKRKKGRVGRRRGKRGKREVVGESDCDSEVEGGGEDAEEVDEDEPSGTIPIARYNAMLAVLRNTLYMFVSHFLGVDSRLMLEQLWRDSGAGLAGVHARRLLCAAAGEDGAVCVFEGVWSCHSRGGGE